MCETPDKVSYLTLRSATEAALEQTRLHGVPQRPYRDSCNKFHLTTKGLDGNMLTVTMVVELASLFFIS